MGKKEGFLLFKTKNILLFRVLLLIRLSNLVDDKTPYLV
jgi:hypothetical protein